MAGLDLGKMVGPLPLGGWLLVVAGGLGVGYVINRNAGKPAADTNSPVQLAESGVGMGGMQLIETPPQFTTPEEEVESNQQWGRKVAEWLVAQNLASPTVVQQAVNKFLTGLPLNPQETALIGMAIPKFGVPPEGTPVVETPPPTTEPPPPSTSAPKPVAPVSGLKATAQRRAVTFSWSYNRTTSPIGGYKVTIKDLKRGRIVASTILPASSTSYRYTAPRTWTSKTKSKVQIWITPFAGGWAAPVKRYGPGRGASGTPII
jgi:hypothetical protein